MVVLAVKIYLHVYIFLGVDDVFGYIGSGEICMHGLV